MAPTGIPNGTAHSESSQASATFGAGIGISPLPPFLSSSASALPPTIAILSLGEMGMGIASLLVKYSYPVITNLEGRSAKTKARAALAGVQEVSFEELIGKADVLLSILPPAEALPLVKMASKVLKAKAASGNKRRLFYMDLNAISPSSAREMDTIFSGMDVIFIDGGIIGFPPRQLADGNWFRPSITTSGPVISEPWFEHFASLIKITHISPDIGAASGLKMCFGSIYKGLAAVATQAYITAKNLGVLEHLRGHLLEYFPGMTPIIENSILGEQRKAYRWIREAEEIEATFAADGGWERDLFKGVADVFHVVAEKTTLEKESKADVEEVVREICLSVRRKTSKRGDKTDVPFRVTIYLPDVTYLQQSRQTDDRQLIFGQRNNVRLVKSNSRCRLSDDPVEAM
ncbi:hypothetical protein B2J93_4725 [Marssonina coronariae]|uniref:6-phosphogluconate dehydrogenase C-terminal domain-like protein n=1 Tax=Diplocarpon coronariae TaxID=2795749 RepID=A0A218Z3Q1_9HELO|nr:hypothetical protein B2J93_4725 [Marssonina coronariae]